MVRKVENPCRDSGAVLAAAQLPLMSSASAGTSGGSQNYPANGASVPGVVPWIAGVILRQGFAAGATAVDVGWLLIRSSPWDANGKRRGWHDKPAHPQVFNVSTGQDPSERGGLAERTSDPVQVSDPDDRTAGQARMCPVSVQSSLRLSCDDGRCEDIGTVALMRRILAGYDGDMISSRIAVQDSSRSVSKTHRHVHASTTPLVGRARTLTETGARVHFANRCFVVGRA